MKVSNFSLFRGKVGKRKNCKMIPHRINVSWLVDSSIQRRSSPQGHIGNEKMAKLRYKGTLFDDEGDSLPVSYTHLYRGIIIGRPVQSANNLINNPFLHCPPDIKIASIL